MTRRCSERRFFLQPRRVTNEIFLYVLAVAARRYGILVHAFCVLSNHCHLVVTDRGRPPSRLHAVPRLPRRPRCERIARAVRGVLGDRRELQRRRAARARPTSSRRPHTCSRTPSPPASSAAGPSGRPLDRARRRSAARSSTARRPKVFFDPKGYMPETAELELTVAARLRLRRRVPRARSRTRCASSRRHHQRAELRRGADSSASPRVLAQNPFSRPPPGEPRFGLKPRIAARDKWRRIEALQRRRSWMR